MKWWIVGSVVGVVVVVLAIVGMKGLAATPPQEAVWLTDYGRALTLARQSGKPLFIVFRCER